MKHGFCHLSQVAVRSNTSHHSEMVNQLLFGETFEILDSLYPWILIRGTQDKYEGFIEEKQFLPLDNEEWARLSGEIIYHPAEIVDFLTDVENQQQLLIVLGSNLPGLLNHGFSIAGRKYHFQGNFYKITKRNLRFQVLETAKKYLGAPYLWGGRSPFGIDSSGFVQVVYKIHDINLPRDAAYQVQIGETIHLIDEALPGDLAFFDNSEGAIVHAGILLENSGIIHSCGEVRIDKIDHHGIFNTRLGKYTHQLRLIKRVLTD